MEFHRRGDYNVAADAFCVLKLGVVYDLFCLVEECVSFSRMCICNL